MKEQHIETVLTKEGKLLLQNLPFKQGDEVEIIILERSSSKTASDPNALKSTVIRYDDPLESATSPEDWEVLK